MTSLAPEAVAYEKACDLAVRRLVSDASTNPRLDKHAANPMETVGSDVVMDLFVLRLSDRVGRKRIDMLRDHDL